MKKDVTEVFREIDKAILTSLTNKPVPIDKSIFIKKYKEIKKRFMK